jgi:hypothetical protein
LGINWNFDLPFHPMMEEAKRHTAHDFFLEFFIIAAWSIWKQRNDFIFNRGVPSLTGKEVTVTKPTFNQSD